LAFIAVVLGEPGTEATGFGAHYRIELGVVFRVPSKNLNGDD
jgi:hypothetical protein